MHRSALALGALGLCAALAQAQTAPATPVPYVVAHEGRLLGPDDLPVDGAKSMRFELHVTADGTVHEPLWSYESDVSVSGGRYAVLLGDVAHGGKALDPALFDQPQMFLSVSVGGTELLPRLRLASGIYALRAARAAVAETVRAGGVTSDALADGAVTGAKIADGAITVQKLALNGGKFVGLDADTLDGLDASAFAPAAISTKIDDIATKLTAHDAADLQALNGLDSKLTSANTALAALDTKVTSGNASLDAKLTTTGVALTTLDTKASSTTTALAALDTKVTSANGAIGAVDTKVTAANGALAALDTKVTNNGSGITTVDGKVSSTATAVTALDAKITSLTNAVAALSQKVDGVQKGVTSCPSDMTLIGTAGDTDAYCIDTNRTGGTMNFAAAHRLCRSNGKHMCTRGEYLGACGDGRLSNMQNSGWTWIDQIFTRGNDGAYMLDMIYGGGPCAQASWDWGGEHNNQSNEYARCCKGTRGM